MNKLTVTIGIPAYNEEATIKQLLTSLLRQKQKNFTLHKIIVISDGSTDTTVKTVRAIKEKSIKVITLPKRRGKAHAINTLFQSVTSDVLVLFDADVILKDTRTVAHLIKPFISSPVALSSARVNEEQPSTFTQKMLSASMQMKKEIFEKYNHGNNIYTCHGRAYALSRNLYTKLRFKKGIVAEDAYTYLYAVKLGFTYQFADKANVFYELPHTLADHQKQSIRFLQSFKQLTSVFGNEWTEKQMTLPRNISLPVVIKHLITHPVLLGSYIVTLLQMKITSIFVNELKTTWNIAKSSKQKKGGLAV